MMGALDLTAQPGSPAGGRSWACRSSHPRRQRSAGVALADTAAAPEGRQHAACAGVGTTEGRGAAGPAPAPAAPESEDPVDLSRLHYGIEDCVKIVPRKTPAPSCAPSTS